jgi:hypothetical protein
MLTIDQRAGTQPVRPGLVKAPPMSPTSRLT